VANWINKLNLSYVWDKANDYEISVQELARITAERLSNINKWLDEDLIWLRDNLVDEFETIAEDEEAGLADFNYVMQDLYDWADTPLDSNWAGKKVCWIETYF